MDYADDFLEKGDSTAKFNVQTVALVQSKGFNAADLAEIRNLVTANEKLIITNGMSTLAINKSSRVVNVAFVPPIGARLPFQQTAPLSTSLPSKQAATTMARSKKKPLAQALACAAVKLPAATENGGSK
jgi:hypothetical protein